MPVPSALPLRSAAAVLGGVGVACGYAPLESPVLAWFGLSVFVGALYEPAALRPVRRGALLGLLFGVGFLTFLVWWVHVLGYGVLLALVAVQVPFYVVFAAAFCLVAHRRAWPLWGGVLWMATEYLRSVIPFGGFPWGRLAFATVGTPLDSYARWVGVSLLSGIAFLLAALTVLAVHTARRSAVHGLAPVAAIAALLLVGALLPTGLATPGRSLRIAIVQGNVPGTGANGMGQQRQVLQNHVRETRVLAEQIEAGKRPRPQVVLWPENASDIDPIVDASAGAEISEVSREIGAPILVGAILDGPTDATALNVGIAWSAGGAGQRYVKRHLVPFGEYVPFRSLSQRVVPMIKTEIPRDILPGRRPGVIRIGPTTVGDMMCFDVVFDSLARDVVNGGAQLLVVQTNNATYLGTSQPEQQWQIARMRAIETGRFVAVPSTDGVSGVIGPHGDVRARAPVERATTVSRTVTTATGVTTGVRFGGWVEWTATVIAALVLLLGRRRAARL